MPTATHVYFDRSGRIVRFDAHADVFQGLSVVLASNPRDAVTMMAGAQIDVASMIPDPLRVSDWSDNELGSVSVKQGARPSAQDLRVGLLEQSGGDVLKADCGHVKTEAGGNRHSIDYILS
ncbi:hypothetical protein PybrP1_008007 [[Pythium] brassicae (nom. inval.)]|nr:hypothetical protein PybrP1_008007 [[Pythium] brassicae (nom. inval.)]